MTRSSSSYPLPSDDAGGRGVAHARPVALVRTAQATGPVDRSMVRQSRPLPTTSPTPSPGSTPTVRTNFSQRRPRWPCDSTSFSDGLRIQQARSRLTICPVQVESRIRTEMNLGRSHDP